MNLSLLPGTEVGIVDDLCKPKDVAELYEFLLWADTNKFQLNTANDDDQSMMDEQLSKEEKGSHIDNWALRNYSLELYPSRYEGIVRLEVEAKANKAFVEYLRLFGREEEAFRPITLTTFHVLKGGDEIEAHIDCFEFGIVYYLNQTEDTQGGDLRFIDQDIYLPFKANRMLIIPSNIEHEVTPVLQGRRFSSTDFVPMGDDWSSRTI